VASGTKRGGGAIKAPIVIDVVWDYNVDKTPAVAKEHAKLAAAR
jgi:hypothetical protein